MRAEKRAELAVQMLHRKKGQLKASKEMVEVAMAREKHQVTKEKLHNLKVIALKEVALRKEKENEEKALRFAKAKVERKKARRRKWIRSLRRARAEIILRRKNLLNKKVSD